LTGKQWLQLAFYDGFSTINELSEEFLLRFYALHKRHIPQIKSIFDKRGGVRLHLDETGEAGNEIVFMAKEGEASGGELLRAARQITNNCRQHTNELFVEVKDSFGNVVEIMRDNNIEERSHRWSRMHLR